MLYYILQNREKDRDGSVSAMIGAFLADRGADFRVILSGREIPDSCDAVITLGGDGTVLRCARYTAPKGIPIMGINLGNLGYLTDVSRNDILTALERLLSGEYYIEKRMMLSGRVEKAGADPASDTALNDIVIVRQGPSSGIRLHALVNDAPLYSFYGDGMICATPTGSTAYNLSAGGPVVSPSASMLLLTPLAPHSLISRSIVLPPDDEVTILLEEGPRTAESLVSFDGERSVVLQGGDKVVIRRSETSALLIRQDKMSFLEVLRTKMQTV